MNCSCSNETIFKGNQVAEKIDKDNLSKVDYGSKFGDVLYRCPHCEQWWEENLSEASNKDWPPVLAKLSEVDIREKYNR